MTWESADDAIATVDSTGRWLPRLDTASPRSWRPPARLPPSWWNWTNTTNWLSNEPLDEWFGVEADDSGNVTQLSLAKNNLVGSIPLELAAHRIHYDHPYATEVEGYPGLLVHGPLTALLLLDAATRHGTGPVTRFRYRALAPLFADQPITLAGRPGSSVPANAKPGSRASARGERVVEARGPKGTVAMQGWVRY